MGNSPLPENQQVIVTEDYNPDQGHNPSPKKKTEKPNDAPKAIQARESLDHYMKRMVMQAPLKKSLLSFRTRQEFTKLAQPLGYKPKEQRHHCVLAGGPGTGKTSVAKVLANFMHETGITATNNVVIRTAHQLIGSHIGHTAPLVHAAVDEAIDGVLFIDEAYAFYDVPDFGNDAVTELVALMENHANDLVVIIGGYPKDIEKLYTMNAGLKDRFAHQFPFDDFTPDELEQILIKNCKVRGLTLAEDAKDILIQFLQNQKQDFPDTFANARTLENILDATITAHAENMIGHGGMVQSWSDLKSMKLAEKLNFLTLSAKDAQDAVDTHKNGRKISAPTPMGFGHFMQS